MTRASIIPSINLNLLIKTLSYSGVSIRFWWCKLAEIPPWLLPSVWLKERLIKTLLDGHAPLQSFESIKRSINHRQWLTEASNGFLDGQSRLTQSYWSKDWSLRAGLSNPRATCDPRQLSMWPNEKSQTYKSHITKNTILFYG